MRNFPDGNRAKGAFSLAKRLREEEGTNLLEYALVVILFLMMMFGIAAFGHMLFAYHFVNEAAKSAARFAAVNGSECNSDATYSSNGKGSCMAPVTCSGQGNCTTCSSGCSYALSADVSNYVEGITPSTIDWSKVSVTTTWDPQGASGPGGCGGAASTTPTPPANQIGCTVEVTVSYSYRFIFPLIRSAALPLSSTSEVVIAH